MKKNILFSTTIFMSIMVLLTIISCEKESIKNSATSELLSENIDSNPPSQSRSLVSDHNVALTNRSGSLISGISKANYSKLPMLGELCSTIIVYGGPYGTGTPLRNAIGIATEPDNRTALITTAGI